MESKYLYSATSSIYSGAHSALAYMMLNVVINLQIKIFSISVNRKRSIYSYTKCNLTRQTGHLTICWVYLRGIYRSNPQMTFFTVKKPQDRETRTLILKMHWTPAGSVPMDHDDDDDDDDDDDVKAPNCINYDQIQWKTLEILKSLRKFYLATPLPFAMSKSR